MVYHPHTDRRIPGTSSNCVSTRTKCHSRMTSRFAGYDVVFIWFRSSADNKSVMQPTLMYGHKGSEEPKVYMGSTIGSCELGLENLPNRKGQNG